MSNQRELSMDEVVKLQAMAEKKVSDAFHVVGSLLLGLTSEELRQAYQDDVVKNLLAIQRLVQDIGRDALDERVNAEWRRLG